MVVVDAVDDEVESAAQRVIRLPVEDEPVQPVLGQGPDQEAEGDQEHDVSGAITSPVGPQPHARDDHGQEDDRRHGGMVLQNRSMRRFSKRGGEALSRAVRSCAIGPPILTMDHSAQHPRPDARAGRFAPVGLRRPASLSANGEKPRPPLFVKKSGNARMRPARPARRCHHRRSVQRGYEGVGS